MLRPLFSLNRANVFTQVEQHTEHLVNCIPTSQFIDLQPLFFQFTFDTTTFLLFGKSMNSLQQASTSAREAEFSEAFRISQDFLFRRGRLGDLYWLIGGKEFRRQCEIVHRFIDEAVQEALSVEYQDGKVEDVHSFLDALVRETRDPRVLRDQLLNIMLAGRDTTACCLTWTFRLLAQHPDVLAKLRVEIRSIVGVGDDSTLPDRNTLKKMKYLTLVVKEGTSPVYTPFHSNLFECEACYEPKAFKISGRLGLHALGF
jgi:cytochrome P450